MHSFLSKAHEKTNRNFAPFSVIFSYLHIAAMTSARALMSILVRSSPPMKAASTTCRAATRRLLRPSPRT